MRILLIILGIVLFLAYSYLIANAAFKFGIKVERESRIEHDSPKGEYR